MKKLTKIVSMLLAVAICVLLPNTTALTASADGPVTYYIKYSDADNSWRYQEGSWKDGAYHRDLYFMNESIKDGDIIVVDGTKSNVPINVSVRLSNLTLAKGASVVVSAKSIDTCYVLGGNVSAVSGDITNAYVYDDAVCTFNNNVDTLNILNDPSRRDSLLRGTVSVGGTVDHLIGNDGTTTHFEHYNFVAGKLLVEAGAVKTDASFFSKTASTSGSTPAQPTTSQPSSSADEYDDVPKTGDNTLVFWLLGISALCLAGRYTLKKA